MQNTTLRKLLDFFEESKGAISIQSLARELGITSSRVEDMLEYWIRKGKIKTSTTFPDCGSCGVLENCPFILEMPRTYELVDDDSGIIVQNVYPG
jgi:hypothetical protein